MTYRTDTDTTKTVCAFIGWRPEINAIETMTRGRTVYVRGTALKPDEWRELWGRNGGLLPDGRKIVVK